MLGQASLLLMISSSSTRRRASPPTCSLRNKCTRPCGWGRWNWATGCRPRNRWPASWPSTRTPCTRPTGNWSASGRASAAGPGSASSPRTPPSTPGSRSPTISASAPGSTPAGTTTWHSDGSGGSPWTPGSGPGRCPAGSGPSSPFHHLPARQPVLALPGHRDRDLPRPGAGPGRVLLPAAQPPVLNNRKQRSAGRPSRTSAAYRAPSTPRQNMARHKITRTREVRSKTRLCRLPVGRLECRSPGVVFDYQVHSKRSVERGDLHGMAGRPQSAAGPGAWPR